MRKTFLSLLVFLLAACSAEPNNPNSLSAPPAWVVKSAYYANEIDTVKLSAWWRRFHDKNLNKLVAQTLENNPDLHIALSRIQEARGLQDAAQAKLFPALNGEINAGRSRQTFFQPVTGGTYNTSFDASYEIDLFGKNRAALSAAEVNTLAQQKDYEWVKLSLIAEVTRTYVAMCAAEKQRQLAVRNLKIQRDTLNLVRQQYQAGGSSEFDFHRTALQVNQSSARIADYKRQKETLALALITLTGITHKNILSDLGPIRGVPQISISAIADAPARVMARRPDIAAANLRFAEATKLKQSQIAAVFPTLSLSGLFGISKTLLVNTTNVWSLGTNVAMSLLDFGRVKGSIQAASAREYAAFEIWRKTILQGVQDVETALVTISRIQEQLVSLKRAQQNAEKSLRLAKIRYREGDASLIEVLDTQRQKLETDNELINAESNYAIAIVALYKALGQY